MKKKMNPKMKRRKDPKAKVKGKPSMPIATRDQNSADKALTQLTGGGY